MLSNVPFIFNENKPEENISNEGAKNIRQMLDSFLSMNKRKLILLYVSCFLSLISFIFYVLCTYIESLYNFLDIFDIIVFIVYLFEYLSSLILAHDRINHLLTYTSLLDLITTCTPLTGLVIKFLRKHFLFDIFLYIEFDL